MDVQDSASAVVTREEPSVLQCPFNFQFTRSCHLQKHDHTCNLVSGCSNALPSSLELGALCPDPVTSSDATATRVRYELQAFLFYEDILQAAISQDIKLYDSACVAPPPLTIEHYPGEFRLEEENRLSRAFIKQPPRMTIRASEPGPCQMSSGCGVSEVTLPLHLQLRNHKHFPPKLRLRIKSTLHGTTLITTEKMGSFLSCKEAARSPRIAELKTRGRDYTRECEVPQKWQDHGSSVWTQNMTVRIPLVANQVPVPTFSSPTISRRYSLSLRIELCGLGGAKFSFKIPVQLMYLPRTPLEEDLPPTYALSATQVTSCRTEIDRMTSDHLILQSVPPSNQLPLYVR